MQVQATTASGKTTAADTGRRWRAPVDLEALVVWALRTQRADRDRVGLHEVEALADGAEPSGWSRDGVATLIRRGEVGCTIDGGGAIRGISPRMPDDAVTVAAAIGRIADIRRRSLVYRYGASGGRPEWLPYRQRLVPVPSSRPGGQGVRHAVEGAWEPIAEKSDIARSMLARGEPIVDRHGRSRIDAMERGFSVRRNRETGSRELLARWCPLRLEPTLAEIRAVNEVYAEWHAGMMRLLGEMLDAPLTGYRVTGFAAPAWPWGTAPARDDQRRVRAAAHEI